MAGAEPAELTAARAELVRYSTRLVADGLAIGSAGNISVRAGDAVAITPSGLDYQLLTPADICLVGPGVAATAGRRPSSETPMHLAVYAATGAAAVVHTHSPEVVALSAACTELPAVHYAITALGGPVPVAPYQRFGSAELAAAATQAAGGRTAVILQNHGAVTWGCGLDEAYQRAGLLEWLARVYRLARCYGEPRILSAAELAEVTAEMARIGYGSARADGAPDSW
jgi:L-fuculose-phosphate aldolase